jgi:hypothetical protein
MRARPQPADAGVRSRSASRALHRRAALVGLLAAAALLVPAAGAFLRATPAQAARPQALAATAQPVVLADDEGLRLVGPVAALGDKPAPELDDLSRTDAARLADLPRANIFFRGAVCRRQWRFRVPVLLTLTLPKAVFARTSLPLYRYQGGRWEQLRRRAVVGDVNTTATATIVRPGRYAVCLTRAWRVVREDGYRLVVYTHAYAPTTLLSPVTLASGATSDPAVIRAVMDVTGQTEDKAKATLVSYDSTTEPVEVLQLTSGAVIVRNWSGASTVGRWFAPSGGGALPSPQAARAMYALPAGNLGIDATLHLVKPGTALITGVCADMTAQPGYGPWATGGGEQFFGPRVSTYPPPAYDPARTVIVSELRWEESEPESIAW